jgi:hypothetical protein
VVRSLLLAIALTAAGAAPAQEAAPEIRVEGERAERARLREEAFDFVRATGVAWGATPAARWLAPLCPRVRGLDAALSARVEATIRSVAQEAGAPLAAPGCKANLLVSFAADGRAVARIVAAREPVQFRGYSDKARRAILESEAPVRWWFRTEERGVGGDLPNSAGATAIRVDGGLAGDGLPSGDAPTLTIPYASLISTFVKRGLTTMAVIVDVNRAEGKTLDAVSDYVAFVALAGVRSDVEPQSGSILGLFGTAAPPPGLTARDRALLKKLYAIPLDREARRHRSQLAGAVAEAE